MRRAALALVGAAALAGGATAAAPPPLTATARPAHAGAARVQLTVKARLDDLQCGRVVRGPLLLGLPAAASVPRRVAPGAVTIGGAETAGVRVTGHVLALQPGPPKGVICDVIGPGEVTVVVRPSAGVRNPRSPGAYRVWLRLGAQTVAGRLAVSR
ncbi:MAG TPA: hypothetical protein VFA19_14445 [Gaiellaceae bacterium]|nr:hypothetical protein [Gaiellaceae bacterium]